MKKSLSLLLAIAMVFTMFSGVAFAADNGSDSKAKLYDAGVLKGSLSGDTMDDATWTRQNVTVLLSRLYNVEEEAQATAKGHTFTDVTDSYYDGFITWAVEEGLFTGHSDVRFGYNEDITAQQFAAVLLRALGVEHDYEDAVSAAVEAGILAEELDNDSAVLRGASYDILVATLDVEDEDGKSLGERLGLEGWVPEVPAISAAATGVEEVTVTFNKAIDTDKASLVLKRGTATVSTETTWADDNKSATLKLTNTKINEADYTVELKGLEDTITASFTAENETVSKLEYVTTSDEIASTTHARVKLRAENQYGELASFSAASYSVVADDIFKPSLTKDSEGYLVIRLDTESGSDGNGDGLTQGLTMIPIYVYYNGNHLTASKTFKLGFTPFITKLEIGELEYDNGGDALVNDGDTATAPVKLYDQYGNPVTVSQGLDPTFNNNIQPYSNDITVTVDDFNNDDEYQVRISLDEKLDKASTHVLTLFAGSSSDTVEFQVSTSKVATKIEFASFEGTLAKGDSGKLVGLIAYDANGEQLTAQEIADNAHRISITASGLEGANDSERAQLITVGPDKGKVRLSKVTASERGFVFLTASILTPNANSFETYQIPVHAEREPSSLAVDKRPDVRAVLGANSEFEIVVKDQYGDTVEGVSADYQVEFKLTANDSQITVPDLGLAGNNEVITSDFGAMKDGFEFDTTAGIFGRATLRAILQDDEGKDVSSPVSVSIESINPDVISLNYSLEDVDSIYAAGDSGLALSATDKEDADASFFNKSLSLKVRDNAGNSVAYPDYIYSVSSSNSNIVLAKEDADPNVNKGYVLGNKPGQATVTAVVYRPNGSTVTLTSNVTVSADLPVVDSISSEGNQKIASGDINVGTDNVRSDKYMKLRVKDQYGNEYKDASLTTYDSVVGIRYTVSDMTNVKVVVDSRTGLITSFNATSSNYQFVVTATAPNGESTSTVIYNN